MSTNFSTLALTSVNLEAEMRSFIPLFVKIHSGISLKYNLSTPATAWISTSWMWHYKQHVRVATVCTFISCSAVWGALSKDFLNLPMSVTDPLILQKSELEALIFIYCFFPIIILTCKFQLQISPFSLSQLQWPLERQISYIYLVLIIYSFVRTYDKRLVLLLSFKSNVNLIRE